MSLLTRIADKYRHDGLGGLASEAGPFLTDRLRYYALDVPWGLAINRSAYDVYAEDWDLFVVLDACRFDLLRSLAVDYPFLDTVDARYSKASSSKPWLERNFGPDRAAEMAATACVTGNPFTDEVFDGDEFGLLDEVWRYAWDDDSGTVPPRPITDRAITVARERSPERLLVHYMQPHFPALDAPELGGRVDPAENHRINSVWDQLETDELDRETVWEAYADNCRAVLDEVELLLANCAAERAVITADHGNGFGEFGVYGHPADRAHWCVRKVPWVTTTARDTGDYAPATYDTGAVTTETSDRLAALGYLDE
jgi:hypothetical protein